MKEQARSAVFSLEDLLVLIAGAEGYVLCIFERKRQFLYPFCRIC